jgi:hypothetical protein
MRYAANPEDLAVAVGEYVAAWEAATSPGSLDAAWAEAEAAKPDGRCGIALSGAQEAFSIDGRRILPYSARLWMDGRVLISCEADSPAAALRALTVKLRGEG